MWLLKFHLAFSILCLLPVLYIDFFMDKERSKLINELFSKGEKTIPRKILDTIKTIVGCFIPVVNVLFVAAAFIVGYAPEDTLREMARKIAEEICEKQKENENNGNTCM